MGWVTGFCRALVVHKLGAWISLGVACLFGIGIFAEYSKIRDATNDLLGRSVMPETVPFWAIAIAFLLWVIGMLAHKEAMRYWRAARITFQQPEVHGPFRLSNNETKALVALTYSVTIDVKNEPYKLDTGSDVERAWVGVELFDLHSKPMQDWECARWENNEHPPYEGSPRDHFPDAQNYRTLSANRSSSKITIVTKPIDRDNAYRMRGVDQITGWFNDEHPIPKGTYLVRVRISGKGLSEPAECIFGLHNLGSGRGFELFKGPKKIQRYWPSHG